MQDYNHQSHPIAEKPFTALSLDQFESLSRQESTLVLDTRSKADFQAGFSPKSIFLGIDGNFNAWISALITKSIKTVVVIAHPNRLTEVYTKLKCTKAHYELAYLYGGFQSLSNAQREMNTIQSISIEDFALTNQRFIIDVRKPSEYYSQHLIKAQNIPLDNITEQPFDLHLNDDISHYIYCATGYRSLIFISILKSKGFHNLINIKGGFRTLKYVDRIKLSEYACPTSMPSDLIRRKVGVTYRSIHR